MRFSRSALLAMAMIASPLAAFAAPIDVFTLTGNGLNLNFSAPASPQPDSSDPTLGFFLGSLNLTANGVNYTAQPADFFVNDVGGGFALQDDDDLIEYFSFSGPQLRARWECPRSQRERLLCRQCSARTRIRKGRRPARRCRPIRCPLHRR